MAQKDMFGKIQQSIHVILAYPREVAARISPSQQHVETYSASKEALSAMNTLSSKRVFKMSIHGRSAGSGSISSSVADLPNVSPDALRRIPHTSESHRGRNAS